MTNKKKRMNRLLSFICILTILLPIMVPNGITYASVVQKQEQSATYNVSEEVDACNEGLCDGSGRTEGCVLDEDDLTVFDTWDRKKNFSKASLNVENATEEKSTSNCKWNFNRWNKVQGKSDYPKRGKENW